MSVEQDIAEIKRDHFEALKGRRVILLVEADYGYEIEQWMPDGVAPTSGYDTPQEAAARALQLLGLKEPVTPQSWPEVVGLGDGRGSPPRHSYPRGQMTDILDRLKTRFDQRVVQPDELAREAHDEIEILRSALRACRNMVGHPDNIAFIDKALNQDRS